MAIPAKPNPSKPKVNKSVSKAMEQSYVATDEIEMGMGLSVIV